MYDVQCTMYNFLLPSGEMPKGQRGPLLCCPSLAIALSFSAVAMKAAARHPKGWRSHNGMERESRAKGERGEGLFSALDFGWGVVNACPLHFGFPIAKLIKNEAEIKFFRLSFYF